MGPSHPQNRLAIDYQNIPVQTAADQGEMNANCISYCTNTGNQYAWGETSMTACSSFNLA